MLVNSGASRPFSSSSETSICSIVVSSGETVAELRGLTMGLVFGVVGGVEQGVVLGEGMGLRRW